MWDCQSAEPLNQVKLLGTSWNTRMVSSLFPKQSNVYKFMCKCNLNTCFCMNVAFKRGHIPFMPYKTTVIILIRIYHMEPCSSWILFVSCFQFCQVLSMCILIGKMELLSKFSLVKSDVPVQRKYLNTFTHCQLSIPLFLVQNVMRGMDLEVAILGICVIFYSFYCLSEF
jgi:hypothetical protein